MSDPTVGELGFGGNCFNHLKYEHTPGGGSLQRLVRPPADSHEHASISASSKLWSTRVRPTSPASFPALTTRLSGAALRRIATFSAHTASPPPPSRTPAGLRASSRHASIAPRTTSARGPLAWAAPRTRPHRSIPAPPTPAGASRLPRAGPYPTPREAAEPPSP